MPYSKAHWFVLALLPVTLLAFWPSYFGSLREAPLAHHLHGVTSTLWILLIAGQSFAIHSRRLPLHRAAGRLVFALAPLLIGAFSLVTWVGAQKSAVQHPFYEAFGRALLTGDALLVFATALLVYLALRYRRRFHLHGALMISTVMGLLPPILARLFNIYVPRTDHLGPGDAVPLRPVSAAQCCAYRGAGDFPERAVPAAWLAMVAGVRACGATVPPVCHVGTNGAVVRDGGGDRDVVTDRGVCVRGAARCNGVRARVASR